MEIIAAIILTVGLISNTLAIISYAELKLEQLLDK